MNQHTKFEVRRFIDSIPKIWLGQNLKSPVTPIGEYSVIESQVPAIFYERAQFDDCYFSHFKDMIMGVKIDKHESRDPDTPL